LRVAYRRRLRAGGRAPYHSAMKPTQLDLIQLRDGAEIAATIAAAAQAGITTALAGGPVETDRIAEDLGLNGRATRIVVGALADAGYAERSAAGFRLSEHGRQQLGDDGAGAGLPLWLMNLRAWVQLPEVLASGEPVEEGGTPTDDETLARYMAGMAAAPKERVERLVDLCLARVPDAALVLDLGGGPGHFARAFIERGARATLVDTPETVEFVATTYGLADTDGLKLVGGDFVDGTLPDGPFDIVLMSNITHLYPPAVNRRLIQRVAEAVRPGGAIAIADFVRQRSPRAARFALVMLLRTQAGDTYAEQDYHEWLGAAGLEDVRTDDIDPERQLITALRPRGSAAPESAPMWGDRRISTPPSCFGSRRTFRAPIASSSYAGPTVVPRRRLAGKQDLDLLSERRTGC